MPFSREECFEEFEFVVAEDPYELLSNSRLTRSLRISIFFPRYNDDLIQGYLMEMLKCLAGLRIMVGVGRHQFITFMHSSFDFLMLHDVRCLPHQCYDMYYSKLLFIFIREAEVRNESTARILM